MKNYKRTFLWLGLLCFVVLTFLLPTPWRFGKGSDGGVVLHVWECYLLFIFVPIQPIVLRTLLIFSIHSAVIAGAVWVLRRSLRKSTENDDKASQ